MECGLDGERLRLITLGNTSLKCKDFTASQVAQPVKNPPAIQLLGQEAPLERGWATHSSVLGLPWWLSW